MRQQSLTTKISLLFGVLFYVLGIFMMCYCPWIFALSTVSFGITAAASNGRLRWYAAAFVAASAITSIEFGKMEVQSDARARENALKVIRLNEERQKAAESANQP